MPILDCAPEVNDVSSGAVFTSVELKGEVVSVGLPPDVELIVTPLPIKPFTPELIAPASAPVTGFCPFKAAWVAPDAAEPAIFATSGSTVADAKGAALDAPVAGL